MVCVCGVWKGKPGDWRGAFLCSGLAALLPLGDRSKTSCMARSENSSPAALMSKWESLKHLPSCDSLSPSASPGEEKNGRKRRKGGWKWQIYRRGVKDDQFRKAIRCLRQEEGGRAPSLGVRFPKDRELSDM